MSKVPAAKPTKTINVQVPGEVPAADTPSTKPETAQAQPAKVEVRDGRDYRSMRADEIDAKTLKAPVLSKDGWVCPA